MLIVSLTGGIATGKSVVALLLEGHGCFIHHADLAAHQLMAPQEPAWEKIVARFGPNILKPDNTINRAKLGSIVFSDKTERLFIDNLLHPLVFEQKEKEIIKLKTEGLFKIFISEAALTIEAGYTKFFDKIIITHCEKKIQIKRLMKRDLLDRNEALLRIESQMPSEKKLEYADYTIDTSGTFNKTIEQTEHVFKMLMSDYEQKYSHHNDKKQKI